MDWSWPTSCDLSNQFAADFPHVARAHRDDQVARPRLAPQVLDDLLERRQVDRLMTVTSHALDEIVRADRVAFLLAVADEVDVRHDRLIRGGEAGCEIFEQKSRPAVLVRLEDADQPLRLVAFAQGRERRADLRRVVAVVIDDGRSMKLADARHAAVDAGEPAERLDRPLR